jgi:uncharacterized protein YndB with AHSA1/START domain
MTAVVTAQLEHTVYVRATPDQVWDAMTNPDQTARYYYGSPVESTWQPGAEVVYYSPDRSSRMIAGHVVAIEPGRRLVLSLQLLYDPRSAAEPAFEQTWSIENVGGGLCKLTVTHSGLALDSASYEQIAGGLPLIVSSMKSLLETGEALQMDG